MSAPVTALGLPIAFVLLHPRYWLTWLGIGVLWLVVQLP
ncbi:hypothetical protein, partial [Escherichia coli]